jgi:hypothetical protein
MRGQVVFRKAIFRAFRPHESLGMLMMVCVLALGVAVLFAPGSAEASESHTQAIDTGNSLNAVSCVPQSTDCVVSDSKGNALYSTNVSVSSSATWTPWTGPAGTEPSEAVACPATSLCTIAAGHAEEPGTGGSVYYATSLGGAWKVAREPTYGADALSCASSSQCVSALAEGFIAETTRPASEEWFPVELGLVKMTAVDCFTSSFCAVVDSKGNVHIADTEAKVTGLSGSGWKATDIDGTAALHGIACTSRTSCLAIDGAGNVLGLAINNSGTATVAKHDIDGTNDLSAITCTGFTCATVDGQGNVFVSGNGGASWAKELTTGTDLTSVSCASNALCLTADTTGNVTAFAPAVVSIEPCGSGGGVQPLGGGNYELCALASPHGVTIEACRFEVGTGPDVFTSTFPCQTGLSGTEPVEVHAQLTGLEPGTTYYYRLAVSSKNGTEVGPEEQFATELLAPSVISESVSDVTEGDATLEAQINPGGEATYYAEYGTSACQANTCGTKTSGEGFLLGDTQEEGSLELVNLKPNTTYHYWVVATNSAAPAGVHGEAQEFTTSKSWEEIRNQEDEQLFKGRTEAEAKSKAEAEARTAAAAKEHQEEEAAAVAKKKQEEAASKSVSIKIVKVKEDTGSVTVTLDASRAGTVTVSGPGLRTRTEKVDAGTKKIKVALTKAGESARKHHKKVKITVVLKAAGKTVSESKTVKL